MPDDLDHAAYGIEQMAEELFNLYSGEETKDYNQGLDSNVIDHYEQYDLENDLKYFKNSKCIDRSLKKPY